MSKLDFINGRIRQGSENPFTKKREESKKKKDKHSSEKRPFWKRDWRG